MALTMYALCGLAGAGCMYLDEYHKPASAHPDSHALEACAGILTAIGLLALFVLPWGW